MKRLHSVVLVVTLAACGEQPAATPDVTWSMRLDDAEPGGPGDAAPSSRIAQLPGGGIEVQSGPNATLWQPGSEANGSYRLSLRVTTTNEALHGHGAGLVFGGSDVLGPKQAYTYFLVRGDGWFLIKTRAADDTDVVCEWTEHAAVHKEDEEFTASNLLAVEVGRDTTRFLVNDQEVFRCGNGELRTEGRYGARLVHDLLVRFTDLQLQALGQ